MGPTLVVLAAGMGSRYGGLKQIDPVGPSGELIIDYSVHDAMAAGFVKLVFVIRRDIATAFRDAIGSRYERRIEVQYAYQELDQLPAGYAVPDGRAKPWGTGHAVLAAADVVSGPFAVINADDFYGQGSYVKLTDFMRGNASAEVPEYALVAYRLRNTLSAHGHVSRGICTCHDDGLLERVSELTHIVPDGSGGAISTTDDGSTRTLSGDEAVSMNFWGFDTSLFARLRDRFTAFLDAEGSRPGSEFYLPFTIDELISTGACTCRVLRTDDAWAGVTYQEDRPAIKGFIRDHVTAGHYPTPL